MRGEFEVLVHHHDDERSTEGHLQQLGRDFNLGNGGVDGLNNSPVRILEVRMDSNIPIF